VNFVVKIYILLGLLASATGFGQVYVSPSSVKASRGATCASKVTWTATNPTPVVGMQFSINYSPTDFTAISVTPGPDLTKANKTLSCQATAPRVYSCVIWGQNQTPIVTGQYLLAIQLAVSPTAASSSVLYITNAAGATAVAVAYPLVGTSSTITIR
jgi:hypothetical protein